jgi:hypothetical protein
MCILKCTNLFTFVPVVLCVKLTGRWRKLHNEELQKMILEERWERESKKERGMNSCD